MSSTCFTRMIRPVAVAAGATLIHLVWPGAPALAQPNVKHGVAAVNGAGLPAGPGGFTGCPLYPPYLDSAPVCPGPVDPDPEPPGPIGPVGPGELTDCPKVDAGEPNNCKPDPEPPGPIGPVGPGELTDCPKVDAGEPNDCKEDPEPPDPVGPGELTDCPFQHHHDPGPDSCTDGTDDNDDNGGNGGTDHNGGTDGNDGNDGTDGNDGNGGTDGTDEEVVVAAGTGGPLAVTGSPSQALALAGSLMTVLGALMVAVVRRRRDEAAESLNPA